MTPVLSRVIRARLTEQECLLRRRNVRVGDGRWVLDRYRDPVVTAAHVPLAWRVDFNPSTNPFAVERLGVNAAFNPGAIDTRVHVATTTIERLLDYVEHTPEDGLRSAASVAQRIELIERNREFLGRSARRR